MYLLTASPGEETYTAFGHSAIRVYDPASGYDVVYNYGTFNFSTPNFYLKFTFGRLMYQLSKSEYSRFFAAYQYYGQAMYEQKLNLTNKEKWQLFQNLEKNYLPENRSYRYDFFYDNCATRIRDIIEKSVDGKVIYDSLYIRNYETFRQLITHYLYKTPWTLFGVNILMGKGTDSIATMKDYMFLPEHVMGLYATSIIQGDGTLKLLASKPVELYPTVLEFSEPSPFTLPVTIFSVLFLTIMGLTILEKRKKLALRWFDAFLFFITGILGLLILALMTASLHKVLENNLNIIWANPINLVILIGILFAPYKKWLQYLKLVYTILLILFIPGSFIVMKDFSPAIYPMVCILIIRSVTNSVNISKT
jgi:hypothetical protein